MHDSYMYRCVFMLDGDRTEVVDMFPTSFTKGFWLSDEYKVTGWLSGTTWIPASKIIFIKKELIKREGE